MEPTESESKAELDRYCEALICKDKPLCYIIDTGSIVSSSVAIREEIREIEEGKFDQHNNVFKVCVNGHVVIYRPLYNNSTQNFYYY